MALEHVDITFVYQKVITAPLELHVFIFLFSYVSVALHTCVSL